MRRLTRWAASAAGAAGAGVALAVARHRRRADHPSTHPPPLVEHPAPAPVDVSPADDPQAALDAARKRLRERADDLRRDIEGRGNE